MSEITYERWKEKYIPMSNYITPNSEYAYETYGKDFEYLKTMNVNHIWTEIQSEDKFIIVNGMRFVNRIQYFITHKPWTEDVTVLL